MTRNLKNLTPVTSLVVCVKRRRPACVNLQAVMGGDRRLLMRLFDAQHWVTDGIDTLQLVTGCEEHWQAFARELERRLRNGDI
jgi:hypothetical protein